jgi:predicted metal-dependent hydrolase
VGHNATMTLFDLSDLTRPGSPSEPSSSATSPSPHAHPHTALVPDAAEPPDEEVFESAIEAPPEVEVRISKRRKKTSEAKWVAGRIVVSVPAHLSAESRQKTVDWLVERLLTRHQLQSGLTDDDLLARAIELSDRYLVGAHPVSVRWVTNQTARWGSCSYYSGHIRVSHRLRVVPEWVLDSVLVHEVAHLSHADHSPAFHKLADAYPRHKEAGIFLAGYGLGLSNPIPPSAPG